MWKYYRKNELCKLQLRYGGEGNVVNGKVCKLYSKLFSYLKTWILQIFCILHICCYYSCVLRNNQFNISRSMRIRKLERLVLLAIFFLNKCPSALHVRYFDAKITISQLLRYIFISLDISLNLSSHRSLNKRFQTSRATVVWNSSQATPTDGCEESKKSFLFIPGEIITLESFQTVRPT